MIKFEGGMSGEAKERFLEKVRTYEWTLLCVSLIGVYPLVILLSIRIGDMTGIWWYPLSFVIFFLLTRIPKSKKEIERIIPKCITINQEYLACVTEKGKEQRVHADVKEVQDCKTYYEIVFRFGKLSPNFICQKDLMTQGTIEEFEKMFQGKIEDLTDFFE